MMFLLTDPSSIPCSGGSDNVVNLWRIASCSSAPWIEDAYAVNMASLSADGSADSEEPARGRVNNMKSRLGKDSFEDDGAADAPLDNNSGRSGSMDTSDELHYARTNIMALAGTSSRGGAGMDQTTGTKIVSDPPDIKVRTVMNEYCSFSKLIVFFADVRRSKQSTSTKTVCMILHGVRAMRGCFVRCRLRAGEY